MINLDQTPHPLVEDHYHIRDLINAQEKRHVDRNYHRERIKNLEERESLIANNPTTSLTDFWCDECQLDFKAQSIKQVEEDWSGLYRIAFYKSKCFRQHWCIRLITDRYLDRFFQRSKKVAMDRGSHFRDTIQPFETGFNMLYGKPNYTKT